MLGNVVNQIRGVGLVELSAWIVSIDEARRTFE